MSRADIPRRGASIGSINSVASVDEVIKSTQQETRAILEKVRDGI
jgi:hypothetical protein